MPKPATLNALVEVIRASRLVPDDRLKAVLSALRGGTRKDVPAPMLLDRLILEGTITSFQASQLAAGRWKGFEVGNYVLTDKIGSGGMGQVFAARHRTNGRQVAVKVLNPQSLHDATARARFEREARAAAAMVHQNIVRVLDVDTKTNPPYLVMEYIDGLTWQAAVARSGTLTTEWVAYLGRQVASGLQCAHEAGTVHRDIKPANLLLDRRGQAKILDLGIARCGDDSGLTNAYSERVILGTADYLAPEQAIDSSNVDTRADLYALGGTLYFLLAGRPPFPEGGATVKLMKKQLSDPIPIERLRPDVPTALGNILRKLMERNPKDRYAVPAEAMKALAGFSAPEPDYLARLFSDDRSTLSDTMQSLTPTHSTPTRVETESDSNGDSSSLYVSYRPNGVEPPSTVVLDQADLQPTLRIDSEELGQDAKEEDQIVETSTAQINLPARVDRIPMIAAGVAAAVAVGLLIVAGIVYAAFGNQSATTETTASKVPATQNRTPIVPTLASTLVVSRSGKPDTYPSIANALKAAKNGYRIEIRESIWEEALHVPAGGYLARDLTIVGVSPTGEPTVWRKSSLEAPAIVHLLSSRGLAFDHFTFDGGNTKTRGVFGIGVGGVTIRNCNFVGIEDACVEWITPEAAPTPNIVRKCRFEAKVQSGSAIRIAAPVYEMFSIKPQIAECRFEGPFGDAIRLFGHLDAVDIRNNRFHRCGNGVFIVRGYAHPAPPEASTPPPPAVQVVTIERNTFSECNIGIHASADLNPVGSRITVMRNYFHRVKIPATLWDVPAEKLVDVPPMWIAEPPKPDVYVFFRARVELPPAEKVPQTVLNVHASGRYTVFVNGQTVGSDTSAGWLLDRHDITSHLKPGLNVVAVRALHHPLEPGCFGLLARIETLPEGKPLPVAWKCSPVNESKWRTAEFDDSLWAAPVFVTAPHFLATARDIVRSGYLESKQSGLHAVFPRAFWNVVSGSETEGSLPIWSHNTTFPIGLDPADDRTFLRPKIPAGDSNFDQFGMPQADGRGVAEN